MRVHFCAEVNRLRMPFAPPMKLSRNSVKNAVPSLGHATGSLLKWIAFSLIVPNIVPISTALNSPTSNSFLVHRLDHQPRLREPLPPNPNIHSHIETGQSASPAEPTITACGPHQRSASRKRIPRALL